MSSPCPTGHASKQNFSAGFRCGGAGNDIMNGKPTGVVRVSLGPMSTLADVDRFLDFLAEFYRSSDSIPEPTLIEAESSFHPFGRAGLDARCAGREAFGQGGGDRLAMSGLLTPRPNPV